jgi:hypothetical protein
MAAGRTPASVVGFGVAIGGGGSVGPAQAANTSVSAHDSQINRFCITQLLVQK